MLGVMLATSSELRRWEIRVARLKASRNIVEYTTNRAWMPANSGEFRICSDVTQCKRFVLLLPN